MLWLSVPIEDFSYNFVRIPFFFKGTFQSKNLIGINLGCHRYKQNNFGYLTGIPNLKYIKRLNLLL
jgi:hypothetical protein